MTTGLGGLASGSAAGSPLSLRSDHMISQAVDGNVQTLVLTSSRRVAGWLSVVGFLLGFSIWDRKCALQQFFQVLTHDCRR